MLMKNSDINTMMVMLSIKRLISPLPSAPRNCAAKTTSPKFNKPEINFVKNVDAILLNNFI